MKIYQNHTLTAFRPCYFDVMSNLCEAHHMLHRQAKVLPGDGKRSQLNTH